MPRPALNPAPAVHACTSALALVLSGPALAYDVNDRLSINGILAGAYQCQQVSGDPGADNACRGAGVFQPELSFNPTKQDQVFAKFGFAAGNGLNPVSPFVLVPWAASLEADVKDINGRDRSYLLEAWYAHTFEFGEDNRLQVAGGILDSTAYVNTNAYANDEYTQFMNEAFVNAPNAFLPSYDLGGALVWNYRNWTFSGLGMNIGENADGNNYNFYAAEAGYHLDTALGGGNYRLLYTATSAAFLDPQGEGREHREAWSLSFDQALGKVVGAFLRLGWQAEDAAVNYQALYSGGLDFKGAAWGREADNVGIGYARLDGGNLDIERTGAFEAYYRFVVNDHLALTADLQYMEDRYRGGEDVAGWVFGARAVVAF